MGARLALALAIRHPQRVSSLMLIGVDPGIVDDADRQARIQWEDRWVRLLLEKGLPSFVSEWEKLPLFASQNRLSQTSQLQQRLSRLQHRPDAILWALRTLGTGRMPNLWPHVPSLQMPISLVTGEVDEKFSTIAQKLTSIHPFIEHHVISGSGHNPILEAPAQMLAVFSSHLTRSFGESQR
ncbi:MAG TPA: 2-succinyl-6-hydroxy-2,4-cyclohexadiene-1-carboxylate synthase, partial [Pseudomonadota bacterium]|nr:2-succinyl-6-hydroxy-2,4-cyclohexadiene-1-carboxylate synthase [Pseudomonadota bacterium]